MAPATIEVGAAETVLTLQPKEERPLFFWLFHNHQRYFATSISYPDGYRYNQHFSLLITPGPTRMFRLEDAPAPQLSLQNESMGRPYFQVVELPSGPVTDDSLAKAIQSGQATDYNDATVVRLEYGKTYAVTADATYSATENHVAKGVFSPEPGFTYKMLTCGETGAYGQNCGRSKSRTRTAAGTTHRHRHLPEIAGCFYPSICGRSVGAFIVLSDLFDSSGGRRTRLRYAF